MTSVDHHSEGFTPGGSGGRRCRRRTCAPAPGPGSGGPDRAGPGCRRRRRPGRGTAGIRPPARPRWPGGEVRAGDGDVTAGRFLQLGTWAGFEVPARHRSWRSAGPRASSSPRSARRPASPRKVEQEQATRRREACCTVSQWRIIFVHAPRPIRSHPTDRSSSLTNTSTYLMQYRPLRSVIQRRRSSCTNDMIAPSRISLAMRAFL